MKKKRITYGIYGMMEYQAVIKTGSKSVLKVTFENGSLTAMGTNPATYSTSNYMLQHAIENSQQFKSGLIKKVNIIDLDEDVVIDKPITEGTATVGAPSDVEAVEGNVKVEETSAQEDMSAQEEGNVNSLERVEFTCNEDAKDYLEEKYGVVRSKLKNRQEIINVGATYGVEVVFVN